MILQSPLKKATNKQGFYHELQSLDDFKKCIFQGFGEHLIDYSQFGIIGHNGLDIGLELGTEVFASHDGMAHKEVDGNQGIGVVIVSSQWYDYDDISGKIIGVSKDQ